MKLISNVKLFYEGKLIEQGEEFDLPLAEAKALIQTGTVAAVRPEEEFDEPPVEYKTITIKDDQFKPEPVKPKRTKKDGK